ncbi:glycosyltransferase family 2 protein [Nocardioides dilutus]
MNINQRTPSATLVTVTYNSRADLEALRNQTPRGAEWVVVDNASTDGSADLAVDLGATVLRLLRNVGFSAANNVGARTATGDVLIFCNPDVKTTADGIRQLAATAWATGAVVAPQLVNGDGSLQENGRGMPFPHRKVRHFFQRAVDPTTDRYVRHAAPGQVVQTVWVTGAVVAIRADQFSALGGWNEKFFLYCEDIDLCLRAWEAGMRVYIDGSVRWEHRWDRAGHKSFRWQVWRHEVRSNALLYRLHAYCLAPLGWRGRHLRRIERDRVVIEA